MAFAKPPQITSWSFSRFGTYSSCPFKAKLTILEKLQEPKNAAMERGTQIHDGAEKYLKGEAKTLSKEMAKFKVLAKRLRDKRKKDPASVIVEDMWVFKKDWTPTVWNDWNGAWVRIKVDVAERTGNVVNIGDWKSGKFRPDNLQDYIEQLDLYATAALIQFGGQIPDIQVIPQLHYVDAGLSYPEIGSPQLRTYTMADLPRLKKEWVARTKAMLNDKKFAPKPNRFCGFCHFRKDNVAQAITGGGRCQY
jgi:CRISPR/Cas system-associated exonuclease Cas4 (RecB family)